VSSDRFDLLGNRNRIKYKVLKNDNTNYLEGNIHYDYDNLYQLTEEHRKDSADTTSVYKVRWSYDDAGNRDWQKKYIGSSLDWESYIDYAYNAANQLTQEDKYDELGGTKELTTEYSYDGCGNMTDKEITFGTGNDWRYSYDKENRQTKVEENTGSWVTRGEYWYDAYDRRIRRDALGVSEDIKYFYDGPDCIAEYNADSSDALLREYLTPIVDENVAQFANSNTYYYLHDGLGSVRNVITSGESVTHHYTYYAFGESYLKGEGGSPKNRYTYTGREWDSESSTLYYRARQYSPSVGRFLGRDPIRGDTNLYAYVDNAPVLYVDPYGLQDKEGVEGGIIHPDRLEAAKKKGLVEEEKKLTPKEIAAAKKKVEDQKKPHVPGFNPEEWSKADADDAYDSIYIKQITTTSKEGKKILITTIWNKTMVESNTLGKVRAKDERIQVHLVPAKGAPVEEMKDNKGKVFYWKPKPGEEKGTIKLKRKSLSVFAEIEGKWKLVPQMIPLLPYETTIFKVGKIWEYNPKFTNPEDKKNWECATRIKILLGTSFGDFNWRTLRAKGITYDNLTKYQILTDDGKATPYKYKWYQEINLRGPLHTQKAAKDK
jgi:RHS repeat-associated protein